MHMVWVFAIKKNMKTNIHLDSDMIWVVKMPFCV
jgi:hypothetical protein